VKQRFIPESVLERIRQEIDLLKVIRESVQLSAHGREWRGQCPLHAHRRRPPLLVLPEEKQFRCLSCGVEGDAITFVMKFKRCTFREAVAMLSERFLPQPSDPVLAVLEQAARYYEQMLWEHSSAEPARGHLRERSISEETGRAWRLGYAPAGWTNLTETLLRAGISTAALESAGLSVARTSGKGHYDRFRARL
jgi:DNA primase